MPSRFDRRAGHELLMMCRDMHAMGPMKLLFWDVMPLGVIAGFAMAHPIASQSSDRLEGGKSVPTATTAAPRLSLTPLKTVDQSH
jgi:hypothetical protein